MPVQYETPTFLSGAPDSGDNNARLLLVAGSLAAEANRATLRSVAEEFGLSIVFETDLVNAASSCDVTDVLGVLFERETTAAGQSWLESVSTLRQAFPFSKLIPCHGFSEPLDQSQLTDAGAFHFLWLPLKENELRQCFGFIWQTQQSSQEPAFVVPGLQTLASAVQALPPQRTQKRPAQKYTAA